MFSVDERVAYYARCLNKKHEINLTDHLYRIYYDTNYSKSSGGRNKALQRVGSIHWANFSNYYDDFDPIVPSDIAVLFLCGEVAHNVEVPCFTKSRPIESENNILLPLNYKRHWGHVDFVYKNDIKFKDKNNKIVWRGCNSGRLNSEQGRLAIVERWVQNNNPLIDIGFHAWNPKLGICPDKSYIKPELSIKDQLESKFLVSVEGNEVATGLKWMLASNSCVLMTKSRFCTWAMEDKLEEWVHYVPLKADYSDLEEKYKWCLDNLDKCEAIAAEGKRFIGDNFLDPEREKEIANRIMQLWRDNVKIIASKEHITSPDAVNVVRKD